jgi:hypothetical protein
MTAYTKPTHTARIWRLVMNSEEPLTVRDVAQELEVSVTHTRRILLRLKQAGALSGKKGLSRRGHWQWEYTRGNVLPRKEVLISGPGRRAHAVPPAPNAGHAESRRLHGVVTEFMHHDGWLGLAGSVITIAIRDWRVRDDVAQDFAQRMMFASPGEEIAEFWEGELGQFVRDYLGCGEVRLEEIGATGEGQRRVERMG